MIIAVIGVGLALIAAGAIAYFAFLRPKATAHEAQETVEKYFNAIGSGDIEAIKSLHTAETQPSAEELSGVSITSGIMDMSYKDVKLNTVKESADEMEVEVEDYSITISAMGQSETVSMSEMQSQLGSSSKLVIKLRVEDGKWLINEPTVVPPFAGLIPDMPVTPDVPAPSGST